MRPCLLAGGVALGLATPALAQLDACPAGAMVMDGTGKRGMIMGQQAAGTQLSCKVDIENGPKGVLYPAWKLKFASPTTNTRVQIKSGHYACGSRLTPQQSEIVFSGSSLYIGQSGSTGSYRFDPATQSISFLSGEYLGYSGRYVRDGVVQLSKITSATPSNIGCTWRY